MGLLKGMKILDFTTLLPGPYATMTLADLGADVLRVVSGSRPDLAAILPPLPPRHGPLLRDRLPWPEEALGVSYRIVSLKPGKFFGITKDWIDAGDRATGDPLHPPARRLRG